MNRYLSRLLAARPAIFHSSTIIWRASLGAVFISGLLWLLSASHPACNLLFLLTGLLAGLWLHPHHKPATVDERCNSEEKFKQLTFYDQLTGLPNRSLLHDRLEQSLAEAKRFNHLLGVLFLDLDRFKYIKDSLGHAAGDTLLQQAAQRMRDCLRNNDTVSRFAGDEFIIALSSFRDPQNLPHIARKLLQNLAEPYLLEGREVHSSASLGLATYPPSTWSWKSPKAP